MKIVVIGAGGYIGSRLSLFLSEKGNDVVAVCRNIPSFHQEWKNNIKEFIFGDIRDEKIINKIISLKAEIIINLISLDHNQSEIDPKISMDVNVQPTWNILNKSTNNGLKKYIYFSTIHVYGKNQNKTFDESRKPSPLNFYGLTHNISEEICNYYNKNSNIDCVNIRLSNSYGEPIFYNAQCWNLVVNDLCLSAFTNKKIIINGDGNAVRDFIHYNTICDVLNKLINKNNSHINGTYHLSSGKSISILQLAFLIKQTYNDIFMRDIDVFINSSKRVDHFKEKNKQYSIVSNKKISKIIDFNLFELKDGIRDLFIHMKKNKKYFEQLSKG